MPRQIPHAADPETWVTRTLYYSLRVEPETRAALEALHAELSLPRTLIANALLRRAVASLPTANDLLPFLAPTKAPR